MTNAREDQLLSSDKPQSDPSQDRLGYAHFARHLANSIDRMAPSGGLVVAVYGAWGLGKSTLINFVRYYLNQLPEETRPVAVTFNPWWFSGAEDLTRRFFDQLRAELNDKPFISNDVREGLADLADLVSKVPVSIPGTPVSTKLLGPLGKKLRPTKGDIVQIKERISSRLSQQSRKILIIIDDIDRLTADETREIFRLVKALADFPNTIYLLSFDRSVVADMLEKSVEGSGDSYLEKIIQVPFELPLPSRDSIRHLLTERIDQIIQETPQELFDGRRWREIFLSGIDHFITTPRDAVRLANTLSVTYPAVDGEVNIVDFVAIETLRTFRPEVYRAIRSKPDDFTSVAPGDPFSSFGYDPAEARSFHDSWLQDVPEEHRQATRAIMRRLFPKVDSIWSDSTSGMGLLPEWRRDRRVCSPDALPAYFRLELPPGAVTATEFRSILELSSDQYGLALKLAELTGHRQEDGTTRARLILSRLADHADRDIPINATRSVIRSLLDVGDVVVSAEGETGRWGVGSDTYISRIIRSLLRRLDPTDRSDALADAIIQGAAVSTSVDVVVDLGLEHGKYNRGAAEPESQRILTAEQVETCERLALERVRESACNGMLACVPRLGDVLYRWRDWAGEDEPRGWAEKLIGTDAGLLRLLETFQGRSSGTGGIRFHFDPKVLEPFVDPDRLVDQARGLSGRSGLTDTQATAVRTFIDGHELRRQGKDPRWMHDD